MALNRKATRSTVGDELSELQVEAEFAAIRNGRQRIELATTLRAIQRYFEADDVEVTSKEVSLICPISMARVEVPVRSVDCRHLECFDLRSYLNFHTQFAYWECPISFCRAQARCKSLRVDEYMSEVLRRLTDESVRKVEVLADGSFAAVRRPMPNVTAVINDEDPYVPDGRSAKPIVKAEASSESLAEPMDGEAFPVEQDQPQVSSLTADSEEQLREALCERTTEAEGTDQMNRQPTESEAVSMEQDSHNHASSLASGEVAHAATDSGPSSEGQPQLENDDCSASDASSTLFGLSDAPALESDSDIEEHQRHAPKATKKQKGPFTCAECARTFRHRSWLIRHQRTHTGDKHYQCELCGKAFASTSNLREHQRTHTGVRPHKCGECGAQFTRTDHLRNHEMLHTGVKPYECAQCGKAFTRSINLRTHLLLHTGEKSYKCIMCGKAFAGARNLQEHERLHTGEKAYECGQCGKVFAQSNGLRSHQRFHTGEKPYKCSQCGTAFSHSFNLRKHERRHTGEKPHKCDHCGKAFTNSFDLRTHKRTHTGEKPYKCAQCDRAFTQTSNLRAHERRQHSVVVTSEEATRTAT